MFKKGLGITLVGSMLLMPTSAFALTKDETVYCKLDSNGTCAKTIVSDHYLNVDKLDELKFTSNLNNINNINGDEKVNNNGNNITIKSKGNDIYVEGNQTKQLPIKLNIQYSIDGKNYEPKKMEGKKGHVVITVKYTNLDKHGDLYTPFVVTLGTQLDTKNNSNVNVSNGKVLSTGTNNIIAAVAAPGLYESLNLQELKNMDTITISYDTNKYEESNIYSVITPKVLDNTDLNGMFDKLSPLYSKVDLLNSSMNKLVNGSNEFTEKFGEYSSKMDLVNSKSKQLTEGYTQINDGIEQLKAGITQLNNFSGSLDALATGAKQLQAGTQQLANNTDLIDKQLQTTISVFTSHVATLTEIANTTTDENTKLAILNELKKLNSELDMEKLSSLSNSIKTINEGAQGINGGVSQLSSNDNVKALKGGIAALYNGVNNLDNGSKIYNTGLNQYTQGIDQLNNATKQLELGNGTLNQGINQFNNDGIKKMNDIINIQIKNVQYKVQRLVKLADEYQSYSESDVNGTVKFILVTNKK